MILKSEITLLQIIMLQQFNLLQDFSLGFVWIRHKLLGADRFEHIH